MRGVEGQWQEQDDDDYLKDARNVKKDIEFHQNDDDIIDFTPFDPEMPNQVFRNGSDLDYENATEQDIRSNNPRFNFNVKNSKSADIFSRFIDHKIAQAKENGEHVLIIDGYGESLRRLPDLTIKKFLQYKDDDKVSFCASCSCCLTARITDDHRYDRPQGIPNDARAKTMATSNKCPEYIEYGFDGKYGTTSCLPQRFSNIMPIQNIKSRDVKGYMKKLLPDYRSKTSKLMLANCQIL